MPCDLFFLFFCLTMKQHHVDMIPQGWHSGNDIGKSALSPFCAYGGASVWLSSAQLQVQSVVGKLAFCP